MHSGEMIRTWQVMTQIPVSGFTLGCLRPCRKACWRVMECKQHSALSVTEMRKESQLCRRAGTNAELAGAAAARYLRQCVHVTLLSSGSSCPGLLLCSASCRAPGRRAVPGGAPVMLHRLPLHHGMPVHQDVRMRLYEGSRQLFCRVDGHHLHIPHSLNSHLPPIKLDPGQRQEPIWVHADTVTSCMRFISHCS